VTPYYEREEWPAFLAAIRAAPDDDLPRLVAADFMEESGDAERAELIRVAVESHRMDSDPEWRDLDKLLALLDRRDHLARQHCRRWWGEAARLYYLRLYYLPSPPNTPERFDGGWVKRGFISRVSAPLVVLHGGECRRCRGRGELWDGGWDNRSSTIVQPEEMRACTRCHGTGLTPGVLGQLLRREPVTAAGIEVADCDPLDNAGVGTYFGERAGPADQWYWLRQTAGTRVAWELPPDVFDALEDDHFASEPAARLALAEALYRLHGPKSEVST
jgi:uncharacterized protein (TIGR02996 family)